MPPKCLTFRLRHQSLFENIQKLCTLKCIWNINFIFCADNSRLRKKTLKTSRSHACTYNNAIPKCCQKCNLVYYCEEYNENYKPKNFDVGRHKIWKKFSYRSCSNLQEKFYSENVCYFVFYRLWTICILVYA